MNAKDQVINDLKQYSNSEKADFFPKFFNAVPGGYGEGDKFIGVTVPNQRKVAKKYYKSASLEEVKFLLKEEIHEYRLTGLFILVYKFEKSKIEEERKSIVDIYLSNLSSVNNWDLVDSSAPNILGAYLFNKENRDILYEFARSNELWKQRIAILSTFYFIKQNQFEDTFKIAEILLHNKHDLIHKAVGWMLREIGNRNIDKEIEFLIKYYKDMPRTMLRYAIEKFEEELRIKFLKGIL